MERKLGKLQPYCLEWSPDAQVARKFFELWWIVHVHWWVYDYFPQFRAKMMSNSYHEWTMWLLMCILIACVFLERIHCFCSKGANVEKTIRHVQATFWLHCDSCSAHDIWKVSGKKLNHHCVYIYIHKYIRVDQWQSNRINTVEQKQVDMRQVCCDINQPHKKEWHWGECNLGCCSGLYINYPLYTELDQIRSLYSISWSTWSYL